MVNHDVSPRQGGSIGSAGRNVGHRVGAVDVGVNIVGSNVAIGINRVVAPGALELSVILARAVEPIGNDQVVGRIPVCTERLAAIIDLKSPADGGVSSRDF